MESRAGGLYPPAWWVRPGNALALIEGRPDELAALPDSAREVALAQKGLTLHHIRFERRDGSARAWLVQVDDSAKRSELYDIRLHLFRLHAERECLRLILDALEKELIPLPGDPAAAGELEYYLEGATGFLERGKVYGHNQSALLETAYGLRTSSPAASVRHCSRSSARSAARSPTASSGHGAGQATGGGWLARDLAAQSLPAGAPERRQAMASLTARRVLLIVLRSRTHGSMLF